MYFINKNDITQEEPLKKKPKLTLEEKLNNLNCYRLLRPDTENSAPAHIVTVRQTPRENSKRQTKLKTQQLLMYASKAKCDPKVYDELPAWKQTKPVIPKTQVIVKADFNKDLWNSEL